MKDIAAKPVSFAGRDACVACHQDLAAGAIASGTIGFGFDRILGAAPHWTPTDLAILAVTGAAAICFWGIAATAAAR